MKITNNGALAQREVAKKMIDEGQDSPKKRDINLNKSSGQNDISSGKSSKSAEIKELNNTIGELQVAKKSIDLIAKNSEKLLHIAEDLIYEEMSASEAKGLEKEAQEIKKTISEIISKSTFMGQNVFLKNAISGSNGDSVMFDGLSIKNANIDEKKPEKIEKYIDSLKQQRENIESGIDILKNEIEIKADDISNIKKSNSAGLDRDLLKNSKKEFASSHNISSLSSDRVASLLM